MVSTQYFENSREESRQMEDCMRDPHFDIYGRRNPIQETGTVQNCIVMQEMAAAKQRTIDSKFDPEKHVSIKLPQRSTDNIESVKAGLKTGGIELVEIILKEVYY